VGFLFGGKGDHLSAEAQAVRLLRLEQELEGSKIIMGDIQELARHVDSERAILLKAVEILAPGRSHRELAEDLLGLVFRPTELAAFYVVTVDWERDRLDWVIHHEGGRVRTRISRPLSTEGGITAVAIRSRAPLYVSTYEEAQARGAILSEAERLSGLIPQSWYGVPLGWGEHWFGLVSFQSFQPEAFSEERRKVFDALGALLARAMMLSNSASKQD
jgi:GAF domain-containing protein